MVKKINDELYKILCEWWVARGWPILPHGLLPKIGFASFIGEKPVIAGFLYKDSTSWFGMMEWVVANPDTSQDERDAGFKELAEHICGEAKKVGIACLMTAVNNDRLIEKYKTCGFEEKDKGMTIMMRNLY